VSFVDYPYWVENVLNPRDRKGGNSPWCFESESWYRAYAVKYAICRAINPRSILEIGVRYGYSAHAFLCDGDASYIGIDLDSASVNAMGEPTLEWAEAMLNRATMAYSLRFHRMDTQQEDISTVVNNPADFTHIDACHTYHGALRDMQAAWPLTNKAMLVDDYVGSPPVRDAVVEFKRLTGAIFMTVDSGTGEALFLK
jgi:hypothetical protein